MLYHQDVKVQTGEIVVTERSRTGGKKIVVSGMPHGKLPDPPIGPLALAIGQAPPMIKQHAQSGMALEQVCQFVRG